MRMRCGAGALLALLIVLRHPLFSQADSATLSGIVADPSGSVIANASVQAANQDTSATQSTLTNSVGLYSFARLSPGTYRISIRRTGFKEFVMTDLVLHVGDVVAQNFKLDLGSSSESVSVTASAVLVNTEDATVGTIVERQVVENMPLNGRSFQGLITLSPGVSTVAPGGISAGQFVVNGQRSDTSAFSVDGVSANVGASAAGSLTTSGTGSTPTNSATGGFNHLVSIDAMQEFRISTSSFAPEFGRSPGGQISLVSRSGTNSFHGTAFDYFRNTVLDANDWFLNAAGRDRGVVQQNDFGGVLGGPVVKNKLFFFVSYEGLRLQAPTPSVKQVPTQAARTLAAAANAGGVVGYMAQFANAYPLPDGNPSTPCTSFVTCAANYTAAFPSKSTLDSTSARIDYRLNQNTSLFGRYAHSPSKVGSDNTATTNSFASNNDVYTAGITQVLGNTMSNDLRFNFTHSTTVVTAIPLNFSGSLSTIYPAGYAQPPAGTFDGTYNIQIRGLPTDGFLVGPRQADNGNDQINIIEGFGWVKGSHRFKFGVDYRRLTPSVDQASFNQSNLFAQTTTALPGFPSVQNVCPASALPAGAGTTVPGYICGQATQLNLNRNFVQHYRYQQYSFFAQDTWKITRRVTLTYGVRWEINPAIEWTSNNPAFSIQKSSYDPNNLSKININPFGTPAYPTTWGNFSPRAGLAFQLSDNPRWGRVLRAGYGIFFDTGAQVSGALSSPYNGRFNNTGAGASTPTVQAPISLADIVYLTPPVPRLTAPVSSGGTNVLVVPDFKLPYVHQLNLTVEQQLGGRQTVTAGYVAALGRRLIGPRVYPSNAGNPAVFAQINPLTGVSTPDAILLLGNYAQSSYHSLQTKFQRQFSGGVAALASYTWSHSIDDASVNNHLPQITLPTAASLSSGSPSALQRGSSDFDVRHNLGLSLVYDIPTPSNPIARAIVGHWSFDPIYHYQTAVPFEILTGATGAIGGTAYAQRASLIPGVPIYVSGDDCAAQNRGQGCPGGVKLNTAAVSAISAASAGCLAPTATNAKGAFCTPAPVGSQAISGTLGRNVVRGFSLQQLDFSLHRDFQIHEKARLRFQADMFNVFNHPSFGPELGTLNSVTFGSTTSMANSSLGALNGTNGAGFNPIFSTGGPRNFQFALKLSF